MEDFARANGGTGRNGTFARMNARSGPEVSGPSFFDSLRQNLAQPRLQTNSAPQPSMLQYGLANAAGQLTGGVVEGVFGLGNSLINASAQRDVANTNKQASNYFADQQLVGLKYNADNEMKMNTQNLNQQRMMWQKDYDIANSLGLYTPAQVNGAVTGQNMSSDVYKLGSRGLTRMPRTFKKSPFAY